MSPAKTCPRCGGTRDLPHPSDADCFRAVDRDIAVTVSHLRSLTKRRSKLLRMRVQERRLAARRRPRPS